MILRVILVLSCGLLVSSNNGYPLIPGQTYPTYQQNGYANPPASQPSDIASYLQSVMVQNQSPSLDLSPSSLRQILLNRILSNQQMQTSFDQNLRGYGSNLIDLSSNAIPPNAMNSYFAAPMVNEYVNNQQTSANIENKAGEIKTEEKRKKAKKRKSKSKRKHGDSEKTGGGTRKHVIDDDLESSEREVGKKSKKRSRKPKTDAASRNNHTDSGNKKKNKKKKRKNKENEVADEDDKVENPKTRRRHKKKPKSKKESVEELVSEQPTTLKTTQIQDGINLAHFNEGVVEENRIPRNPIPEGNDLFKATPNLSENFASNFNFQGLSQFNNPGMSHFFSNYENIYQTMMANNKGTNEQKEVKRSRPQPSKNNNVRRKIQIKNINSTTTEPIAPKKPKLAAIPKINVVTTEKAIYIKGKPRPNNDSIPKEEIPKSIENLSEKNETIVEIENEEVKDMESNIDEPVSSFGYIEDYYPQFTDSAAFTANNREVYVKNLSDTKYYYAVDKENPEKINRMRFEGIGLPERIVKDNEVHKKYDDAEESEENTINKDNIEIKEDIIEFRTPPQLEIPDFQTRKVEIGEINPGYYLYDENDDNDVRFLPDKASIYSEVKIPHYTGTKDSSKKILKDKRKDVETVFARSKVATYGPVYNPDEDSASAASSNQEMTDDSSFKDGGMTYVLAKSLDYPESFW